MPKAKAPVNTEPEKREAPVNKPEKAEPAPEAPTSENPATAEKTVGDGKLENWQDIIEVLKVKSPLIAGVLQNSSAYVEGGRLLIDSENTQFKNLVNGANSSYRTAIKNAAEEVLGKRYTLGPYVKKSEGENADDPLAAFADKLKTFEVN